MNDAMQCSRQKYWSEIDDQEKIRRLREEVKQLKRRFENIASIVDKLSDHDHADGKVVTPLHSRFGQAESDGSRGDGDEAYF